LIAKYAETFLRSSAYLPAQRGIRLCAILSTSGASALFQLFRLRLVRAERKKKLTRLRLSVAPLGFLGF
jgi:hypothetical protein